MAIIFAVGGIALGGVVIGASSYDDYSDHSDYSDYDNYSDYAEKQRRKKEAKESEIRAAENQLKGYMDREVTSFLRNENLGLENTSSKIGKNSSQAELEKLNRNIKVGIENQKKNKIDSETSSINSEIAEIDSILNHIKSIKKK